MKRIFKKKHGVVKGAPSGFIVSLIFHIGAFFIAGLFVVFTVALKPEPEFSAPPPIERPKMKLKKPKVKVKKSSQPKPSSRIVAKVKTREMPEIQLPDLVGTGDGLIGGLGGEGDILALPEVRDVSLFGAAGSIGNDLVGTFYDFNRKSTGTDCVTNPEELAVILDRFLSRGWNTREFSKYYRAARTLYATSIAIPPLQSYEAPFAFGELKAKDYCWLVHYKGKLVYDRDIRFRFWGFGDDVLAVRVDGELVLLSCFPQWITDFKEATDHLWQSTASENEIYPMANHHSVVGDWIELKAFEEKDLEILIGESHGGIFAAMLVVEVDGVEYERNPFKGGPMLPFFTTAPFSKDVAEKVYSMLHAGEATCEMGPVFNDFSRVSPTNLVPLVYEDPDADPPPQLIKDQKPATRTWTTTEGKTFDAKYLTRVLGSVLLENAQGKQTKVPISTLSDDDQEYITLMNPPKFSIDFIHLSDHKMPPPETPWLRTGSRRLQMADHRFGARVKTTSVNNDYDKPLTIEYFAIGEEAAGENFVLLERNSTSFTPSQDFKGEFEFMSDKQVEIVQMAVNSQSNLRGIKYSGYLVTMTDQQDMVVGYATSNEFLFQYIENLKKIPIGRHFNRKCNRVMPDRPSDGDRFTITL